MNHAIIIPLLTLLLVFDSRSAEANDFCIEPMEVQSLIDFAQVAEMPPSTRHLLTQKLAQMRARYRCSIAMNREGRWEVLTQNGYRLPHMNRDFERRYFAVSILHRSIRDGVCGLSASFVPLQCSVKMVGSMGRWNVMEGGETAYDSSSNTEAAALEILQEMRRTGICR